jgi:hypothetical protein
MAFYVLVCVYPGAFLLNALPGSTGAIPNTEPGNCGELPDFLREVRGIRSAALKAQILLMTMRIKTSMPP